MPKRRVGLNIIECPNYQLAVENKTPCSEIIETPQQQETLQRESARLRATLASLVSELQVTLNILQPSRDYKEPGQ